MTKKSRTSRRRQNITKNFIVCSICQQKHKRKNLYAHTCDNLICPKCIFKNVFIHLRKKCPYCRIDYTPEQMKILSVVYKKDFESIDYIAMSEIVKSCDTANDLFDACIRQTNLMLDYKEVSHNVSNVMNSLNNFILHVPFPFILGITKTMNIMIIHCKYFDFIKNYSENSDFLKSLDIKGFALYSDDIINHIPILKFTDIKKIIERKPIYETRLLTCRLRTIKDKLEELEDVSIEITKQRCLNYSASMILEEQTKYRIITIPDSDD